MFWSSVWWTASIASPYFPNDTWAVIIQEWWVGYAFNTGWNSTDSLFSRVVLMSAIMHAMLERRWVQVIYRWLCTWVEFVIFNLQVWIVDKFVGWLMYFPALPNCMSIFHSSTGGLSTTSLTLHDLVFPSSLIFDMKVMSIMLNMDNSISRPPFLVPLSWLLVLEVNSVTYLEWWWFSICCFLWQFWSRFSSRVFLVLARAR